MTFYYYTRSTFKSIFKQYFNYGQVRVRVIRKHPSFFCLKHIIPSIFSSLVFLCPLVFIIKPLMYIIIPLLSLYSLILFLASSRTALKQKCPRLLAFMPVSFLSLHLGYGMGFIAQLCKTCASRIHSSWLFRTMTLGCIHATFPFIPYESDGNSRASESTNRQECFRLKMISSMVRCPLQITREV